MRILIVDDENLARERIHRLIDDMAEHDVVGEAGGGVEALQKIDALNPDVVILDIRMPGMDGMEVARHLVTQEDAPAIIFSTAYDEYAIEAFKVNAVDYLLKPVRGERLKEALDNALKLNKAQWVALNQKEGKPKARTHISSRSRQGIVLVPVDDIYYFRAEHKYVTVRHKDGEVLIEDTLKDLEVEFEKSFLRIHRNSLVAVNHLRALSKNTDGHPCIKFKDIEDSLDVSRRHIPRVRQIMSGQITL